MQKFKIESQIRMIFGEKMVKEDEMLKELKQIRELLAAKPAPPPPPLKGLWNEFKAFLESYKVLGLAVAFIMGVYLGSLVQSLVKDLLLPAIGLALPGLSDLASYQYTVGDAPAQQIFGVGNFLVALITFIIVAFVIFVIVKVTKKWGIQ
jgi:large conductance mechanosensitive channel